MKLWIVCTLFLLSSCVSDPPTQDPEKTMILPSSAFKDFWEERTHPDVLYFAGSWFELRLSRDSIEIVQNVFTDVNGCHTDGSGETSCSPSRWSHHYLGTCQRQDSTLSIQIRFQYSEPQVPLLRNLEDTVATFRIRYSDDSSQMSLVLLSGAEFLNHGSQWEFAKLDHHPVEISSAEISNDCGPADAPETRMTFLSTPCPYCNLDNHAPYSFYLGYADVDQIKSGEERYVPAWRCGEQGCTDSALATVRFFNAETDSVRGSITIRKGMTRSLGTFVAPKRRSRPFCG